MYCCEFGQFTGEFGVASEDLEELNKGPHYGDVYLHGAGTVQNAREHGDSLFGECVRSAVS